jgi:hypothetical protein
MIHKNRKENPKTWMKSQETSDSHSNLGQKEQSISITLPDIKNTINL